MYNIVNNTATTAAVSGMRGRRHMEEQPAEGVVGRGLTKGVLVISSEDRCMCVREPVSI